MQHTIFITGGTGLVGADIIRRLLRDERVTRVLALVRGDEHSALPRLVDAVQRLEGSPLEAELLEKLTVVRGDVTRPYFGWRRQEWQACARRVTHIVHSAADVRFHLPLEEARRVNVGGTRVMLAFAEQAAEAGCLRHFAYVSTAYVCGDRTGRVPEESDGSVPHFSNSYEQSKWECEQLLRTAMPRIPATIFRPSIIVGDAGSGRTNAFKALYVPLRLIARNLLCAVPVGDVPLDVVPVDYVSRAICHVLLGGNGAGQTLHLTAGEARSSRASEIAVHARTAAGLPAVPAAAVPDNAAAVPNNATAVPNNATAMPTAAAGARSMQRAAMEVLAEFAPYLTQARDFDDSNTRAALEGSGITVPAFRNYVDVIIGYCLESCWGKRVPQAVRLRPAA
jgi:long-chain acyl-CoA synthetase